MDPLYVVNNFGQFNHLILRALRDLGIPSEMISNETAPEQVVNRSRGLILGGGPTLERAGLCSRYIELDLPVLGICLGMQIIALARQGLVQRGRLGGYGMVDVTVLDHNEILAGYPPRLKVWASHADEVHSAPVGFEVLAQSDICPIEAIASPKEHLYGVQWHPEVSHTENGRLIFENFNHLCQN